jgi:hypothetical protein
MTPLTLPESPVVRLRSPRDVLAAVPYLLGYRPVECVVVVCVAPGGRLALLARAALDDLAGPDDDTAGPDDDRDAVARSIAARAADVAPRQAVVAVCTDRDVAPGTDLRRGADRLLDRLDAVVDTEAWLLTSRGYRGLDCADPLCCPPGGHPVDQLATGEVSAAFVLAGRAVAPSAADAYRIPPAAEPARALAARAASRWERAGLDVQATPDGGAGLRRWRREGLAAWDQARRHAATELRIGEAPGSVQLPAPLLGHLAAALADTVVRDAVLLTLVPGGEEVAHRTASAEGPKDVGRGTADAIARVVDPRVALLPDEETVGPARAVLEAVVGHVPRRRHAAPLTLLAFVAWWRGDGGLAGHRVRAALALDPGYRLAGLLNSALAAGLPPGWVRRAAARAGGAAGADAGTAGQGVG